MMLDADSTRYNVEVEVWVSELENDWGTMCYQGYRMAVAKCQKRGRYVSLRHNAPRVQSRTGEWAFSEVFAYSE